MLFRSDGAEPSPTSVSALNLLTLAHLTGESSYRARADEAMASFGARLDGMGRAVPLMAAAVSTAIAPSEQIVIIGRAGAADARSMWAAANRRYRPFAVMTLVTPDTQSALAVQMPWISDMRMIDGKATAFVCRGFVCDAPSTDPAVVA